MIGNNCQQCGELMTELYECPTCHRMLCDFCFDPGEDECEGCLRLAKEAGK
jgi:hypothetical protein